MAGLDPSPARKRLRLSERLVAGSVLVHPCAHTRAELFPVLVDALCAARGLGDRDQILSNLEERERRMSTAVGMGLAIPHARVESLPALFAAAATCPDGLDFPVPDGLPVRLVVLLVSPPSAAGLHVQALAAVGRLSGELIADLLSAPDAERFLARLAFEESLEPLR